MLEKNKKGFLGTGIAGIVSIFIVFFILFIFVIASAAIAGKIKIPFVGKNNQIDIEGDSKEITKHEINQKAMTILNSPLDNGRLVKDEMKLKGFSELKSDKEFNKQLEALVEFYFTDNYCFEIYSFEKGSASSDSIDFESDSVCSNYQIRRDYGSVNYHELVLYKENFILGNNKFRFEVYVEND